MGEGGNHSFLLPLITCNAPRAVSAFSGLSLIAPFLLWGPGLLRISGFSALTTWSQKPRGPGALLSLMYKLIFASEPPTGPVITYMRRIWKKKEDCERTDRKMISFFLYVFIQVYNNQKVGCLWRSEGKAETLTRGTRLHQGKERGPQV